MGWRGDIPLNDATFSTAADIRSRLGVQSNNFSSLCGLLLHKKKPYYNDISDLTTSNLHSALQKNPLKKVRC
jgi:hypothetical protein